MLSRLGDPAAPIIKRRTVELHPGLDISFQRVNRWLDNCVANHPECRLSSGPSEGNIELPTRVLDVGLESASGQVRLLESGGKRGRWIALSHCWGLTRFLRTTTENIDSLKNAIDVPTLPQTFQDAIALSRRLQIPYLWIDSLCIVQDSLADWEYESARMGDVYANAYLVIGAGATRDCTGGFLLQRAERKPSVEFKFQTPGTDTLGTASFSVAENPMAEEGDSYLNSRGWCLQEHLLARRFLQYGITQMAFICNSESVGEDRYAMVYLRDLHRQATQRSDGAIFQLESESRLRQYWQSIVMRYATRSLTKESDRLVALSAVARWLQQQIGDRYLAGLWAGNLPHDLLWVAHPPSYGNETISHRTVDGIPSWSWASIVDIEKRQIEIRVPSASGFRKLLCSVLAASTQLRTADPFGGVCGGLLRVRAPVIELGSFKDELRMRADLNAFDARDGGIYDAKTNDYIGQCFFDRGLPEWATVWVMYVYHDEGLVLVAQGEGYRRIGSFSFSRTELFGYRKILGAVQEINIE